MIPASFEYVAPTSVEDALAALADAPTAPGTDSSLSSVCEWQCGHSGVVPVRTRVSNSWPQSRQAYS